MVKKNSLRKLGIMRSGATSGTYKNAKERPTELQMDDVFDAEKDLVGGDKISQKHKNESIKKDERSGGQKTNPLAIIGLIFSFSLPLIGLGLSIVGLVQINKKKQQGKGLAIAGIVISSIVAVIHLILTIIIIAAVFSSSNLVLVEYRDNAVGYTIKYPEKWAITQQQVEGAKGLIIKDDYKNTGKVYGQVEVAFIAAPPNGYTSDVLTAIADSLKKSNPGTVTSYENRKTENGRTCKQVGPKMIFNEQLEKAENAPLKEYERIRRMKQQQLERDRNKETAKTIGQAQAAFDAWSVPAMAARERFVAGEISQDGFLAEIKK